jgi:hypothetical protein
MTLPAHPINPYQEPLFDYFQAQPTPIPILCTNSMDCTTGLLFPTMNRFRLLQTENEFTMSDELRHANQRYKRAKLMPTHNRLFMMHSEESLATLANAVNSIALTDTYSIEPGFFPPEPTPTSAVFPWSQPLVIAPEERDTPLPSNWTGMLNYLSKPHSLFVKEDYLAKLDTNVSPDFYAAVPALRAYLESQEVLAQYAPLKWTGLVGFPPLHLETTPDLPSSWRSRSRPVNPRRRYGYLEWYA